MRTLSKRISGNVRAKAELKDALSAWMMQISTHLQGLVNRAPAIGAKLDEDLQVACVEMEASQEAQGSLTTSDQVANARLALGMVWRPQEDAVLRVAATLRALGTVQAPPALTVPGDGYVEPIDAAVPPDIRETARADGGSEVSFGDHGGPTDTYMAPVPAPDLEAGPRAPRWKRRNGGTSGRPSKSPRRDEVPSPWPRLSTGRTPEARHRTPQGTGADSGEGLDNSLPVSLDWPTAWLHLAGFRGRKWQRFCGRTCRRRGPSGPDGIGRAGMAGDACSSGDRQCRVGSDSWGPVPAVSQPTSFVPRCALAGQARIGLDGPGYHGEPGRSVQLRSSNPARMALPGHIARTWDTSSGLYRTGSINRPYHASSTLSRLSCSGRGRDRGWYCRASLGAAIMHTLICLYIVSSVYSSVFHTVYHTCRPPLFSAHFEPSPADSSLCWIGSWCAGHRFSRPPCRQRAGGTEVTRVWHFPCLKGFPSTGIFSGMPRPCETRVSSGMVGSLWEQARDWHATT